MPTNQPDTNINLSLEHIYAFLEGHAGYRPSSQPYFVHVAGTNGKGSTLAFLRCFLAYYLPSQSVALYTSPHLYCPTERIQLDGQPISLLTLQQYQHALTDMTGTAFSYFEIMTFVFWKYINEKQPDIVLLETGLGGRLDATNVIEKSLALISSIDIDHIEYLGDSIEKIAREKAGIIKPDCPYIASHQVHGASGAAISQYAQSVGARQVTLLDTDYTELLAYSPLAADYQKANLQLALTAFQYILQEKYQIILTAIECHEIARQALQTKPPQWQGRYEKFIYNAKTIIFDGGHNVAGLKALTQSLIADNMTYQRKVIVFGMQNHKDWQGGLTEILKICHQGDILLITSPLGEDLTDMQRYCHAQKSAADIVCERQPKEAIKQAYQHLNDNYHHAIICGSLYLYQYLLRNS